MPRVKSKKLLNKETDEKHMQMSPNLSKPKENKSQVRA